MFKVVTEHRKRPFWTPRTIAASVGVHVLLLGAFVTAAESTPARRDILIDDFPIILPPPAAQPPTTPETPRLPEAQQPPKKGDFVTPRSPDAVPDKLPTIDPHLTPLADHDVSGIGVEGDVVGPPDHHPETPPTGQTENLHDWSGDGPMEAADVSVLPKLSNEREAQRMLQRVYPAGLRDAGVAGHTVVTLIIDKQGNVEPGSMRVLESTHPAFDEAALRAVERFRFTPAQLNGHAVSVVIALPIDWQIEQTH